MRTTEPLVIEPLANEPRTTDELQGRLRSLSFTLQQVLVTLGANLKQRYRGSFAGLVWVLLAPLLTYGVQCLVFKYILKIQVENYFIFLLSGLLPWLFMSQSIEMGTGSFVAHGRLLKSFPVSPLVPLGAVILDHFLNISILMVLFLITASFFELFAVWKMPLVLVVMINNLVAAFAMTWLLATLQVFFRDVRFMISFALNICFFLTPVFYPENFIDEKYRPLLLLNPFHHLILPMRDLVRDPIPDAFALHLINAVVVSILALGLASIYWRQKRNVLYFSI